METANYIIEFGPVGTTNKLAIKNHIAQLRHQIKDLEERLAQHDETPAVQRLRDAQNEIKDLKQQLHGSTEREVQYFVENQ